MQELSSEKSKALVLCSSGIDSTYNLLRSKKEFDKVLSVFFDYNQKSSPQEYVHVKKICKRLDIDFIKVDLPWYRSLSSSLLSSSQDIRKFSTISDIDKQSPAEWVPNRNGVFVSIAAAIAESGSYDYIVIGVNKEEAERYPDNTESFIKRSNELFEFSTLTKPKLISFSVDMEKKEIFLELTGLMDEYNLSCDYIWSCYDSYEKMCGGCESCLRLKRAIKFHGKEKEWKDRFFR